MWIVITTLGNYWCLTVLTTAKHMHPLELSNYSPRFVLHSTGNIHSSTDLYKSAHSSFIHNSSKWETTQIFMNLSVDKQIAGILLSKLKVQNISTCNNMSDPQKYYAKWKVMVLTCLEVLHDCVSPLPLSSTHTCTCGCQASEMASTFPTSGPPLSRQFLSQISFLLSLPSGLCSHMNFWERPSLAILYKI